MLVIEVLSCPDPEYQGTWTLHQNQVYLGYPEGDISPKIEGLPSFAYLIEVLPELIQGTPHPDISYWHLNGKRATRPRSLRIGDVITVMDTKLKIIEAKYVELISKKAILDSKLQKLLETNSSQLSLIKVLKEKTK